MLASSICLAAALLVMPAAAQAQSLTPNVTYNNPPTMPKPPGYTQVVEANMPGRILFIAGQLGYDAAGKQGSDFRTQTTLVFENLKAAVDCRGGREPATVAVGRGGHDNRPEPGCRRLAIWRLMWTAPRLRERY
jgi:hypothetical protein